MKLKKPVAAVLCLLLCALCLPQAAYAYSEIPQENTPCTLTLDDSPHRGVTYRLYQIADVSSDVSFTAVSRFEDDSISFENLSSRQWRALAEKLSVTIARDGLSADAVKTTDSSGSLTFSGLKKGLYLIVGEGHVEGNRRYQPVPFLLCLPDWDAEKEGTSGEWVYQVKAAVKNEVTEQGSIAIGVRKNWEDGGRSDRPAQATVALLRDGEVYETVTLNSENNWRYEWKELDSLHRWQVAEKPVPSGYTDSYTSASTSDSLTFVVTNTRKTKPPSGGGRDPKPDPPPKPDPDPNPGTDPGPNPDPTPGPGPNPEEPDIPQVEIDDPEVPLSDPPPVGEEIYIDDGEIPLAELPQTGQLWWPVPLLAMAGMVLFVIGWVERRRQNYEQ